MTPEALIKAINTRSRINIPITYSAINSLNKLLEDYNLYKVMTILPNESRDFISQLKQGSSSSIWRIKELNRLLIEVNYPLETPKRQLIMGLENHQN